MFKLMKRYLSPYKNWVIIAPILMLIEVASELIEPKLMTKIIDVGIANNDFGYIAKVGIVMILVAAIGITGGIGCLIFASRASQNFGADVRLDAFKKIQEFSFKNIDSFKPSSLITRLTNDITQIQMVVLMSLRMLVRAPLLSVGGIIMAAGINLKMTAIFLVMIPIVSGIIFIVAKKGFPLFNEVQKKLDRVNVVMRENLSGVRVVKAFVRSDFEKEKFSEANVDYKNTTIKAFRVILLLMPLMMLSMNASIIAILIFGSVQLNVGEIAVGDIMAFITYSTQILMSLMMIGMVFMIISRAKVSADRILEVLDTEVDIKDAERPISHTNTKGVVEYKDVTFRYEGGSGDPVLDGISFKANTGEIIAILGVTGSGKSTLVNLMPRLYDVTSGQVIIDGCDVREYSLEHLRSKVSVVLQEAILFSGTIKENLKWGNADASDDEIIYAAKTACAHEFIMQLPDKYETELGQKGVNLSGGQKQRLSIARALVKKPEIIIFDDSTSAVDMVTEKKIQSALRESMPECTKFIIAQRISSVKHADKILLLSGGKIIAEGNHDYLIKNSKDYQEIYKSQVRKEENINE